MKSIDAVTLKDAKELAERLTSGSGTALTIYGPFDEESLKAFPQRP